MDEMLQKAYGNEAMSRARCFTSRTPENVQETVRQDRRITIKEIWKSSGNPFGKVLAVLLLN